MNWSNQTLRFSAVLLSITLVSLAGCALNPFAKRDKEENQEGVANEQVLYDKAQVSLRTGNFIDGIARLEALESHFPFGRYAEQAQLELIYANFMRTDFDSAIVAADRFINLHPQHPSIDYAFYMKGLSSYQRDRGFFDRLLGTPHALRDVSSARQAFIDFELFLSSYPNSLYAKDAQLRMLYLKNILAEAELNVAIFYLRRDAWISATNRAREVIEHYPQTTAVPDALAVFIEANHKLGLHDVAEDALAVLALNFPDYPGFSDTGELVIEVPVRNRDRSFLNTLSFGLLDRKKESRAITLMPPKLEVPIPPQTIEESLDVELTSSADSVDESVN